MKKVLLSIVALFLIASCNSTSTGVSGGLVYNNWKDRDLTNDGRIDNGVSALKKGEACVENILGLVAFGDSSLEAAKKEGRITKVSNVDRTYTSFSFYIPFYQKGCTVALGR